MKRIATCLSVFIFAWHVLPAAVYFVAPTGDDSAVGTLDHQRFNIEQSVGRLVPGDTLFLREGIHYRYINVQGIKVNGGVHHFIFRNGSITHGGGGNISPTYTPAICWGDCKQPAGELCASRHSFSE